MDILLNMYTIGKSEQMKDKTKIDEQYIEGNNTQEPGRASRDFRTEEMKDNFNVTEKLIRQSPTRQLFA